MESPASCWMWFDEKNFLPCRKEELQCGNGFCLMNWLHFHRKDCSKECVSITVKCLEIHLNHSNPISTLPHYTEASRSTSMLDSSVLVAGVVIGLVLFLSCVAILIGSLRKNQCFRHLLWRNASPDCFSHGGSGGERRSSCTEEFPPAFYFCSYVEALSQANITHHDSPPQYDQCVGPGAAQISIPADDPPPYSLIDPCQQNDVAMNNPWEEERPASMTTGRDPGGLVRVQDLHQLPSFPEAAAPPYEAACKQVPLDLKDSPDSYQTLFNRIS